MNDSVDFSIRQFSQAWQIMCSGSPGYTREIVEGIDYIFAGLPIGFFNVALLTGRGNSLAYGIALDASKPVIGTRSFWKDHVPVVGRAGGTPASGAAVMMVDGHRYVALVATDPAHQRRGYAEAAMRRALDVAAQRHGEVMEKRFLEGH